MDALLHPLEVGMQPVRSRWADLTDEELAARLADCVHVTLTISQQLADASFGAGRGIDWRNRAADALNYAQQEKRKVEAVQACRARLRREAEDHAIRQAREASRPGCKGLTHGEILAFARAREAEASLAKNNRMQAEASLRKEQIKQARIDKDQDRQVQVNVLFKKAVRAFVGEEQYAAFWVQVNQQLPADAGEQA